MDWFPRVMALLLIVLGSTFLTDLFLPDLASPPPSPAVCPYCILEADEGEMIRRTRCYIGPFNRICPLCGAGWKSDAITLSTLLEPAPRALILTVLGVLLSIPLLRCRFCEAERRGVLRHGARGVPCLLCHGNGRRTIWAHLLS